MRTTDVTIVSLAVESAQDDIARCQARDEAGAVGHAHEVVHPHRAVEQDREAGDVVGGELLQAEPDAHAERTAEHREQRKVEADCIERDQHVMIDCAWIGTVGRPVFCCPHRASDQPRRSTDEVFAWHGCECRNNRWRANSGCEAQLLRIELSSGHHLVG